MATEYRCGSSGRRQAIVDQSAPAGSRINAIDYLVVSDGPAVPDGLKQRLLRVRCFYPEGVDTLTSANVHVTGGVRVRDPAVRWAVTLWNLNPAADPTLTTADRAFLTALKAGQPEAEARRWLVVLLVQIGDFSRYRLTLRQSTEESDPPPGFDRKLSEVEFSFKVECPSPFDCAGSDGHDCDAAGGAPVEAAPPLDYLARDFNSFRRLMFDRLALTQPAEGSTDPATLRAALVELLAYSADHLSYYQDAVATEAYLGTARRRPSVRRHARMLDYPMHDGCNARTFVHLSIADGLEIATVGDRPPLSARARFLTRVPDLPNVISDDDLPVARTSRPEVFEALHALPVATAAHDQIALHTWGEADCCLPAGATRATLVDQGGRLRLSKGDFLLLEEIRGRDTARPEDADPARRHVVRVLEVSDPFDDELLGVRVVQVDWHPDDALPFALSVSSGTTALAVARGNLVLVDHGATVDREPLAILPFGNQGHRRASLRETELTFRQAYEPLEARSPARPGEQRFRSATSCLAQDARAATPHIDVTGENEIWSARRDLLSSPASARELVVETESDGRAWLRFGDGIKGRKPAVDDNGLGANGEPFRATYRVGNGTAGNVGAEAVAHLVSDPDRVQGALAAAIRHLRNPVAATGGIPPEPIEDVRLYAPHAFRGQERAVTAADWADVAARHQDVQRAVATVRWTGSYHTVFVSVDPVGGGDVGVDLEERLLAFLERYRLAGYDLEIAGPVYVPLDIALTICVDQNHFRDVVQRALLESFGTGLLSDGTQGFFHPDRFTFGQSVYLSQIVARASGVPGVTSVDATPATTPRPNDNRFHRWGRPAGTEIADGRIGIGRLEVARCDNDPNAPDNGQIQFFMQGGA